MKRAFLGELEEVVLLTVAALQASAYCALITQTIDQQMSRSISFPTVHTTLQRLEEKGFVSSLMAEHRRARGTPETPVHRHRSRSAGPDRVSAGKGSIVGTDSNPDPTAMGRLTSGDQHFLKPPRWAVWLLNRFSPVGAEDELQGDLLEMYAYWVKTVGLRKARWRYVLAVLRLIRLFNGSITKHSDNYSKPACRTTFILHPVMIRNYLKIAWRHLWKQKSHTAINLLGMTVAFTASTLLLLSAYFEYSYDRFYKNASSIFRPYLVFNEAEKHL